MPRSYDFLLIGGGLAGSLLADGLRHAGAKVLLIDTPQAGSASKVAAGLVNPVLGPRMSIHPLSLDYLQSARRYYETLGRRAGHAFFHAREISRLFASADEQTRWRTRANTPQAEPFMGEHLAAAHVPAPLNAPYGAGRVLAGGYVDMRAVIEFIHAELRAAGALLEQGLDYADMRLTPEGGECGEPRAPRLVFCEGWRMRANPWFDWLPLQPAKGEILDLRIDEHAGETLRGKLISAGRWLLHIEDDRYRLGATYEWDDLEAAPSAAARETLLDDLSKMLKPCPPHRVTGHQIGVRPASQDKTPMLGIHPRHTRLAVFNGFGSRGALLIPYHVEQMLALLLHDRPIPAPFDIARYWHGG